MFEENTNNENCEARAHTTLLILRLFHGVQFKLLFQLGTQAFNFKSMYYSSDNPFKCMEMKLYDCLVIRLYYGPIHDFIHCARQTTSYSKPNVLHCVLKFVFSCLNCDAWIKFISWTVEAKAIGKSKTILVMNRPLAVYSIGFYIFIYICIKLCVTTFLF